MVDITVEPSPLGPGVVHKSEKSISLKLCINNLKIAQKSFLKISVLLTTLIEQSLL